MSQILIFSTVPFVMSYYRKRITSPLGQEKLIYCFSLIEIRKWMRARALFIFFYPTNLSFNTDQHFFPFHSGLLCIKVQKSFSLDGRGLIIKLNN